MSRIPRPVRLPLVVGVTGHRNLRPEDEPSLERAVEAIFGRLQEAYPFTPLLVMTPLAEGADRLVARVARRRDIPYRVPMPMPLESYRRDFSRASVASFDDFVRHADGPPYAMPYFGTNDASNIGDQERRKHQYALLDAHLARGCHVFLALWDGRPSEDIGGTAQAVRFRVLGVPKTYLRHASSIDAPETGPVHQLYTPRSEGEAAERAGSLHLLLQRPPQGNEAAVPASLEELFGRIEDVGADARDPFHTLYARIENFNRDCARAKLEPPRDDASAAASLRSAAECVATIYQRKYVVALQGLFLATGIAALAFEIYSHLLPDVPALLLLYAAGFAYAVYVYARARAGRWQDRAQDYRALEIGLNVQRVWDAVGLNESVADYYIRRQRSELDWIRDAIRTAHAIDWGRSYDEARGIETVRAFVMDQYAYFRAKSGLADSRRERRAGARRTSEKRKGELHETLSRWSLRTSFSFSGLLVIFGLLAWLAPALVVVPAQWWQADVIFVIATAAVAAALFHDYGARRAHAQHVRRYEMMAGVYGRALGALDAAEARPAWRHPADGPAPARLAVARDCIFDLGREALIENGEWLVHHRQLPIELLPTG